jgi:hypothetical protein
MRQQSDWMFKDDVLDQLRGILAIWIERYRGELENHGIVLPLNSMSGGNREKTLSGASTIIEAIRSFPVVDCFYIGRSVAPATRKGKYRPCNLVELISVKSQTHGSMVNADYVHWFETQLLQIFEEDPKLFNSAPDGRGNSVESANHSVYLKLFTHDPKLSEQLIDGHYTRRTPFHGE